MYSSRQAVDILNFIGSEIRIPATLAGWSSGALIALHAAIKDKKNLIKHIISVEAPYRSSSDFDLNSILKFIKIIFLQTAGKDQKAADTFLRIVLENSDDTNSFDHPEAEISDSVKKNARSILKEIKTRTGEDIDPVQLQSLAIPVDFITGSMSTAFPQLR